MLKANTTVMVSDLERSLDFYTRILGFQPGPRHLDHFAEVHAPGLTLVLHPARHGMARDGDGALSIGVQVADLRATTERFGAAGLSFAFQENQANRLAHFRDPDGTPLYLIEVK